MQGPSLQAGIKPDQSKESLCFIGHSLAPLFILTAVQKHNLQLNSAIFVAPFMRKLHKTWQIDKVNHTFYVNNLKKKLNFTKLHHLIPVSHILYSNNDPYVDTKYALEFAAKLSFQTHLVKNGGHLNSTAGFTKSPQLLNLAKTSL